MTSPTPDTDIKTEPAPSLLPHHRRMLSASAIGDDVIAARGYGSVESMAALQRLGFGQAARRVPTLLIPIWSGLTGEVSLYHHRPDSPRIRDGRPAKYEFPHGARMVVDVHPFVREMARDPAVPLVVTEGVKKADAAISAGLCAVALAGVWNWRGSNEWGGRTALPDWDGIAFKSASGAARTVYLVFDSDAMLKREVHAALSRLGAFLGRRGADVAYVYLPPGERGAKTGLDDYLAAGNGVDALLSLATRTLREVPAGEGDPVSDEEYARNDGGLPCIETARRHLRHMTQDTLEAVVRRNVPPRLFVQSGHLVRVQVDEEDHAAVAALSIASLRGVVSHSANFVQTAREGGSVAILPPAAVVETLHSQERWPGVPALAGVVTAPVVCADGTLLAAPGYHAGSRLFHHAAPGLVLGDTTPTPDAVRAARGLLDDLLADFPFVDDASRAHAWALTLLPFVRPLIPGPTPLHLIDAPQGRTGKSLLAEVCTSLFVPGGAGMKPPPATEEEWAKVITTYMLSGASHLVLDNARSLTSPSLLGALTSTRWEDRLMGGQEHLSLTNRLVWAATCNNMAGNDELTGRSVWVRLDAGVERPDERGGFRHDPIKRYARESRGALLSAALTLIRSWLSAGRPAYEGPGKLGGFEEWIQVMGGLLGHIGVPGFLANIDALRSRVDKDNTAWSGFTAAWAQEFGERPVSTSDLLTLGAEWFAERLGDGKDASQKVRLGRLLGSHVDRVYGGRKLTNGGKVATGNSKGAATYTLVKIASSRQDVGRWEGGEGVNAKTGLSEGGVYAPPETTSPETTSPETTSPDQDTDGQWEDLT